VLYVAKLLERLQEHCGKVRVTVVWHCGEKTLCTTGDLVEACDDFIVVVGETPTAAESHRCECRDLATEKLPVIIVAEHICGVVFDVPKCRKAALPICCKCEDAD
jgi:hypothetical protein